MRSLDGRVVATTRDGEPRDPLVDALRDAGAQVVIWRTLSFRPPAAPGPLAEALAGLGAYDWLVLTSARAIDAMVDFDPRSSRLLARQAPGPRPQVAVVGDATAAAAERRGWTVALLPESGADGARGLVDALAEHADLKGARVLFPAADRAGELLEEGLTRAGARVHRVEAYRTVPTPPDPRRVRADLARGVDAVTFASPSAVDSLAEALDHDLGGALAGCACVAIGPTTAEALRRAGVPDPVVAPDTSFEALVAACAALPFSR